MVKVNGAVILAVVGGILLAWPTVSLLGRDRGTPAIIPKPERLEVRKGNFRLSPGTQVQVEAFCKSEGELLAERLRASTAYQIPVVETAGRVASTIQLTAQGARADLGPEGYKLEVTP